MDTTINVQLTKQDINNILVLIARAEIKGGEAPAVAQLQEKLGSAVKSSVEPQNVNDLTGDTNLDGDKEKK